MWRNLTPQQQAFLMQMLLRQGGAGGAQSGMPQTQPMVPGAMPQGMQLGQPQMMGNPLMLGGNSAVSPQQQAAMLQYQQLLGQPQGWGAGANGNVPAWQLLMGRGPWYGQGTSVP